MKKELFLLFIIGLFLLGATGAPSVNYYHVLGDSMNPILKEGDTVQIVSESYQDGDMVVAQLKNGTKVVKRLLGDKIISDGHGTSYPVSEVKILGAAKYVVMSMEELEYYGFKWENVLAEGVKIIKVMAGDFHSFALTNTGVVYGWGMNNLGQLGVGDRLNRLTPVKILDGAMGNSGVTDLAAGQNHTLALKNGEVYAWGQNNAGQLGFSNLDNQLTPVKVDDGVMGNSDVTAIASGAFHGVAIKGGKVYSWGYNLYGQLGDGSTNTRYAPTLVSDGSMGNSEVTQVAAGAYHTLVIKNSSVYSWGLNSDSRLGDGSSTQRNSPVKVADGSMGNSSVTSIAASNISVALKDGKVYTWGDNLQAALGNGINKERKMIPFLVPDVVSGDHTFTNEGISFVSTYYNHVLIIKNGILYGWGNNDNGVLGVGFSSPRLVYSPQKITNGLGGDQDFINSGITSASTGGFHTVAVKDGNVYSWGRNINGQVGDNTTEEKLNPTKIMGGWIVSDEDALAAAKRAIINGEVNVTTGANQTEKNNAVQKYVDTLLTGDASGVIAKVTYVSGNEYSVAISKGSENDTKIITVMIIEIEPTDKELLNNAKDKLDKFVLNKLSQELATSETEIINFLKTELQKIVDDETIEIKINKISYNPAVSGTSSNLQGTDGSFIFTTSLEKGDETVTTTEMNLIISAIVGILKSPKIIIEMNDEAEFKVFGLEDSIAFSEEERMNDIYIKLVISHLKNEDVKNEENIILESYIKNTLKYSLPYSQMFDISLYKIVGESSVAITNATNSIKLSLTLSEVFNGVKFSILRVHGNEVVSIPYDYDEKTFEVTFNSDKFSTYSIVADVEDSEILPETSDDSKQFYWLLLMIGFVLLLVGIQSDKKSN